jgi:hypothetical protein
MGALSSLTCPQRRSKDKNRAARILEEEIVEAH